MSEFVWSEHHLSLTQPPTARPANLLFRVKQSSAERRPCSRSPLHWRSTSVHLVPSFAINAVADDVIKLVKDRQSQPRPATIRSLLLLRSRLVADTFSPLRVAYVGMHENKIPAGHVGAQRCIAFTREMQLYCCLRRLRRWGAAPLNLYTVMT